MNTAVEPRPFFLPSRHGDLFAIYYPPVSRKQGDLLYIHPFAEEMNKSRRMAALQARALAEIGWGVLQVDLSGCGDSAGDLAQVGWQHWTDNVADAWQWLKQQGASRLGLWGLRLGGLMAMAFAHERAEPLSHMILWQPVTNGNAFLTQFLRLRTAAGMMTGDQEKVTPKTLRAALAQGESLEIAGYTLQPDLAMPMDELTLVSQLPVKVDNLLWLEVASQPGKPLAVPSQKAIAELEQQGVAVTSAVVAGDSFWATQEISECPALLSKTREWLA